MLGTSGLQLISENANTISNIQIILLKSVYILFFIITIFSFLVTRKYASKGSSISKYLPSISLCFLSAVFFTVISTGLKQQGENAKYNNADLIYTFEIKNDDYYIDTDIYEVLDINDKTIVLLKK